MVLKLLLAASIICAATCGSAATNENKKHGPMHRVLQV
jgi:hypothetical protein